MLKPYSNYTLTILEQGSEATPILRVFATWRTFHMEHLPAQRRMQRSHYYTAIKNNCAFRYFLLANTYHERSKSHQQRYQQPSDIERVIIHVLKKEGKMKAVKTFMDITGHGLKRPKDTVEQIINLSKT